MNRPSAIDRLLEELEGEIIESEVEVGKTSKIVIFLSEDDKVGFALNANESKLVLATIDTTQRLIDAIDRPSTASVLLCDVEPEDAVLSILESNFSAVDEG